MTDAVVPQVLSLLGEIKDENLSRIIIEMTDLGAIRAAAYAYGCSDSGGVESVWISQLSRQESEIPDGEYTLESLADEGFLSNNAEWEVIEDPVCKLTAAMETWLHHNTDISYDGDCSSGWVVIDLSHDPIGYYTTEFEVSHWERGDTGEICYRSE